MLILVLLFTVSSCDVATRRPADDPRQIAARTKLHDWLVMELRRTVKEGPVDYEHLIKQERMMIEQAIWALHKMPTRDLLRAWSESPSAQMFDALTDHLTEKVGPDQAEALRRLVTDKQGAEALRMTADPATVSEGVRRATNRSFDLIFEEVRFGDRLAQRLRADYQFLRLREGSIWENLPFAQTLPVVEDLLGAVIAAAPDLFADRILARLQMEIVHIDNELNQPSLSEKERSHLREERRDLVTKHDQVQDLFEGKVTHDAIYEVMGQLVPTRRRTVENTIVKLFAEEGAQERLNTIIENDSI